MSKKILCENTCSLDENEKVSVGEKLAYGGGDLACNLINLLAFSLVTFFYTDALGLNACLLYTSQWDSDRGGSIYNIPCLYVYDPDFWTNPRICPKIRIIDIQTRYIVNAAATI